MVTSRTEASKQRGFTLIELMVVVVIAAVLLTIAVPSFQTIILRSNVDSLQSRLSSAFATARTEAASRNRVVTICSSNNEATCAGGDWSEGWIIFEDIDADGAFVAADDGAVIDVYRDNTDYTIASNGAQSISFTSQGFIVGGMPTLLTVCEPDNEDLFARGLFVNASGLVMKTRDSDGSGIHDSPIAAGTDLTCP